MCPQSSWINFWQNLITGNLYKIQISALHMNFMCVLEVLVLFSFYNYLYHRILKKDFIYLFLEKGEVREKERERNISVWLLLAHPLLGPWPQPRYVPWLSIEPETLWFAGPHSIHWATPVSASSSSFTKP